MANSAGDSTGSTTAEVPRAGDEEQPRPGDGLPPRHEKAILALLNNPTIARAAEAAGVDESTLHRWLRDPAFASAYKRARAESFGQAVGLTQRYAGAAVQTLVKIMADPAAATASKVAAATSLLKFGREGVVLDDLEERVAKLERHDQPMVREPDASELDDSEFRRVLRTARGPAAEAAPPPAGPQAPEREAA